MRVSIICVFLLILTTATHGIAQEQKSIEQDLLIAIDRIATQRGVPREQVIQKTAELFLNGKYLSKSGIGIIRDRQYVVTRAKENVVIAGEDKAVGATSDTPELFVFSQGKVAGSIRLPIGREDDVVLALFTPQKIRIFDWKTLLGGYYSRETE